MTTPLKVIICCLTGSLSLLGVSGNKEGPVNICDNTPQKLTAHRGGTVTIHCKYPVADKSSIKHFCKEDKKSNCSDLIATHTSKVTEKDRYALLDKQLGFYTVIISGVTLEDSGKYLCVVRKSENITTACSTEITLEVLDWSDIPSKKLTHKPGETVKIDCYYPVTHNNKTKFLCKGQNPLSCKILTQTTGQERDVTNGRFKIRDNSRVNYFYVYISNLSTADSGTYWCSSHRGEFSKILLTVGEKQIKTDTVTLQNHPAPDNQSQGNGHPNHPEDKPLISDEKQIKTDTVTLQNHPAPENQSRGNGHPNHPEDKPLISGLISGIVGCLVLSLILGYILVLIRNKVLITQVCCAARGSSEESRNAGQNIEANEEPHYEEILNQQASSGEAGRSVYATVNLPVNPIHYASISFHKDCVSTERDALPDKNGGSTCEYSTVMAHPSHSPGEEQTINSTVSFTEEAEDRKL